MARSRVLSNRVAYDCILQMCYQWCADMCASIGDPKGIGGVEYGKAIVDQTGVQWPAWTTQIQNWVAIGVDLEPPAVPVTPGLARVEAERVDGGLATSGLITIEDAMEIAGEEMKLMLTAYTAKMFPQRSGTYRKMCHWTRGNARAKVYYEECCAKMKANCYRQNKKSRGVQIISTKRTDMRPMSSFKFAGKWAFRAPRGRPPLPEGVWLARYRARRKAQRKTSRRRRNDKRPPLSKAPRTKYGRPLRTLNLKRTLRPSVFADDSRDTAEVDTPEFLADAANEIISQLSNEQHSED
jgi:hypothetical protein